MSHTYHSEEDAYGLLPVAVLILVVMAMIVGYLAFFGKDFAPRQLPRVFVNQPYASPAKSTWPR